MQSYLLDTNILSVVVRHSQSPISRRLQAQSHDTYKTNLIVAGELRFGAQKIGNPTFLARVERALSLIEILPLTPPTETHYAEIRATLERKGTPIGANDLWIAAHALALDMTLVTDNVDEFARVDGLRIENWLRA
ncbi:MAG: type II toxin-antitoxin system VapC family toxin [Sphingomonadaceae bacterium]